MKYAILSDIHANLEALTAVLEDASEQGVTNYACTGDIVGYNADPKACLKIIRTLKCTTVLGNHDYYAACSEPMELFTPAAQKSTLWTRKQLTHFDKKRLISLPLIADTEDFTIVHSSLFNPDRWGYIHKKPAAEDHFKNQFNSVCFFGHTHVPLAFVKGQPLEKRPYETLQIKPDYQYLINPGSVGQPRDRNPKAAYAIYDLDAQTVSLRRVRYDIETTQQKIRAAGLPFRNALRLTNGK